MAPIRYGSTYSRYNPYSRYQPTQMLAPVPSTYSRARGSYQTNMNYRRRRTYRSKFNISNTRTNPVYPRPETKNFDFSVGPSATPQSIPLAGVVIPINSIEQGIDDNQRIGRSIATKSCYYQYVLNFGTGPVPNVIRHMLVWDRQPNGTAPAVNQVLNNLGLSTPVTAPMNLDNKERFVVLADERTTLSPNGDQIRVCNGFRTINQKTTFDNDQIDNIPATGSLLVLFMSDETVPTNQPNFYGTWRVRFIDN